MRTPWLDSHLDDPDAETIWSSHFPDAVGVCVGVNLYDSAEKDDLDMVPIRVRVTTEDGTGDAYLTADDAYELVQALGNAITKAKRLQNEKWGNR